MHAYGIAAVVGIQFDVVSVPARLGPPMLDALRRNPVVAIDHSGGWWLLLTTPGAPTIDDIPRRSGITIHRAGSYIPAPAEPHRHRTRRTGPPRHPARRSDHPRPAPTGPA
jgi:hypothetical protein